MDNDSCDNEDDPEYVKNTGNVVTYQKQQKVQTVTLQM